jgi:hypothetical protein
MASALGYETRAGAAATLLRLHRHGHLNRQRSVSGAYVYTLSSKGSGWLSWYEETWRNAPLVPMPERRDELIVPTEEESRLEPGVDL